MKLRIGLLVNLALLLALLIYSAATWPSLPERIPEHFNVAGTPDRWADRSLVSWFAVPFIAIVLSVAIIALARVIPRKPSMLNLPDKKRLLALPPEAQAPVFAAVQNLLYWLAAFVAAEFLAIQLGRYLTAVNSSTAHTYIILVIVIGVVAMPMIGLFFFLNVQNALRSQLKKHP
jgi:uncharacterized membrane protein